MSKRERLIILGVAAVLFVATFGLTFQRFTSVPLPDEPSQPQAQTVVRENAETVVHYLMDDGKVAMTEVGSVSDDLVGKGIAEIRHLKPEWSIVSFAGDRIVASRPCPEQTGTVGFIRPVDGNVGIFLGEPEGCHELADVTTIEVAALQESVRTLVEAGISFQDRHDVPQILDGLLSSR